MKEEKFAALFLGGTDDVQAFAVIVGPGEKATFMAPCEIGIADLATLCRQMILSPSCNRRAACILRRKWLFFEDVFVIL